MQSGGMLIVDIIGASLLGALLGAALFSGVWRLLGVEYNHDRLREPSAHPGSVAGASVIQQNAIDSNCSNVTGARDVTVNCPTSDTGSDRHKVRDER